MIYSNGVLTATASLIVLVSTSTLKLLDLSQYQVKEVNSAEEVAEIWHMHDAILASVSPTNLRLFEKIKSRFPYPTRPLLILLDDKPAAHPQADFTLSPELLDTQLPALLQFRFNANQIHEERQDLQAELAQLKQDLKNAQRIKAELEVLKNAIVRNVSHELKTPLLQVKSAVALLRENPDEEEKQALIDLATGATGRLEVRVKNITLLGESLDSNPGPIILRDAVEAARRNLRRLWEHGEQTSRIVANLSPDLPPVTADKQGISTVFQLLIDNALKFSEGDIVVDAEVDETGHYIHVCVRDYGIGIAKDQQKTIFDMFYQVDSSSTRRYGGSGVGLAIVRIILENHGSQIKVDSELGSGSTFSFTLPTIKLGQ